MSNTTSNKVYNLDKVLPNIPQDYSNGIMIPVKSFTSEDVYTVSIKLNKHHRKFNLECNCGSKFSIGKRNKCKHILYTIMSLLEEFQDTGEPSPAILKSFSEFGI